MSTELSSFQASDTQAHKIYARYMTEIMLADVSDVQAHLSAIPRKWIQCRVRRHDFRDLTAGRYPDGDYWAVLECRRCRTLRYEDLDDEGYLLQVSYRYPDGYQLEPGTGRVGADGRAAMRIAHIQEAIAKGEGSHLRSVS